MFTITHITTNHHSVDIENMSFGMTSITKRLAFAFVCTYTDGSGMSFESIITYCSIVVGAGAEVPLVTGIAVMEEASAWFAAVVMFPA